MIEVREARESDVERIRDVFLAAYGDQYAYPQFYDTHWLKKMVFDDGTVLLVAEETETGLVQGTASVVMHVGAYADLVGEFGRLVVHPDARGKGVGKLLMEGRLDAVRNRLHVGLVENRTVHPFSQRISSSYGFAAVGFVPNKLRIAKRESVAIYAKHFGPALSLRRNNPRIVPEAYRLAELSLRNCGLAFDAIVDDEAAPYPHEDGFELDEMTADGYATLLRIERGRVRHREIFGPLQLHYGLFQLAARHSNYLLAKDAGQVVGAIGFTVDDVEKAIRVFELVSLTDRPVHFLLSKLLERCGDWEIEYVEVDASAYAPRMQRTLLELGFLPTVYVPGLVFQDVERLDGIKMSRLLVPLDTEDVHLYEPSRPVARVVLANFVGRDVIPRIAEALPRTELCHGLEEEQARSLASACTLQSYGRGTELFREGDQDDAVLILLQGHVAVSVAGCEEPVGHVAVGECLGETSLVFSTEHTATATATTDVEAARLTRADLERLIRIRPDIGVVVYQNLAAGVARKLRRSTQRLADRE